MATCAVEGAQASDLEPPPSPWNAGSADERVNIPMLCSNSSSSPMGKWELTTTKRREASTMRPSQASATQATSSGSIVATPLHRLIAAAAPAVDSPSGPVSSESYV
uniref:Uncharacterized protein n=1 Tax=Oryza meridionalis TaxID=40149 RepID=A0A0E0CAX0_9ORYZ